MTRDVPSDRAAPERTPSDRAHSDPTPADGQYMDRAIETSIRLALIALLAVWCFDIIRPFLVPSLWGLIIAIAFHPGYRRLTKALGGRSGLAATLLALGATAVLLVPAVLLGGSLVEGAASLVEQYETNGHLGVPPPPQWVAGLPLVGSGLETFWLQAADNLEAAVRGIFPHIKLILNWLGEMVAGAGLGFVQFLFAIVISGVLLAHDRGARHAARALAHRLAGDRGLEFLALAAATVRSVTRGILGVAAIQATLAGLGWLAFGIPAAGLWALLALLLSVVQIGIFPLVIPILIYYFFHASTLAFVLFVIWNLIVAVVDNVLKPILLGRGLDVPMAVIFVGAIGGFLGSGIIGLFVGSVVLVIGYKLLLAWLSEQPGPEPLPEHEPLPEVDHAALAAARDAVGRQAAVWWPRARVAGAWVGAKAQRGLQSIRDRLRGS